MIYVTHDQTEALTFADKVVVMRDGEVLQIGTPQELFEAPAHTFVGRFIGSPGMNILPCELQGGNAKLKSLTVPLCRHYPGASDGAKPGAAMQLGIRPEHVTLQERASCPQACR